MLAIEVTFLTGRYVATAYNRRSESEWPPHPARLFSALVATHFATDAAASDRTAERVILEWLERHDPPSIVASDATPREVVTVFVPVNDVALTNVDDESNQFAEGSAALAAAIPSSDAKVVKKRQAEVKKADTALKRAIARATAVPAKPLNPRYGQRVLPEYRGRHPRSFPSMTPDDPRVTYVWADAMPSGDQQTALDTLLRRVVRLGHSSSLVSMRLIDNPGFPVWRPAPDGEHTFRTIEAGQLQSLERAFGRHHEIEPRVMPATSRHYTRAAVEAKKEQPTSMFSDEWVVLRRVGGPSLPMSATAGVARAVRKALMSYADEPIAEILSGHAADRTPTLKPHLAIVPLPFVGHEHAAGQLLGVALIMPRATTDDERRAVYGAVARWEAKYRQEDEDTPTVQLNLGASGELFLERVEWSVVQASLRSDVWCRPANVWSSVTPVALDRNPGDLRSRDARKLADALDEATETVRRACERLALPRPHSVEILPAAPWAGATKARHYPPFPGDAGRTQRVLTHVRLVFQEPVPGPILLGAGRFVGLGLCRPERTR